jgi:hypothetical protein
LFQELTLIDKICEKLCSSFKLDVGDEFEGETFKFISNIRNALVLQNLDGILWNRATHQ